MTRLIKYEDELVAIAGPRRFFFAAALEERSGPPDRDPLRRFVALMCQYSRDVDDGTLPGPYTDDRAELFARSVLIPDDEFEAACRAAGDQALADVFRVPLEQIERKRHDLASAR